MVPFHHNWWRSMETNVFRSKSLFSVLEIFRYFFLLSLKPIYIFWIKNCGCNSSIFQSYSLESITNVSCWSYVTNTGLISKMTRKLLVPAYKAARVEKNFPSAFFDDSIFVKVLSLPWACAVLLFFSTRVKIQYVKDNSKQILWLLIWNLRLFLLTFV